MAVFRMGADNRRILFADSAVEYFGSRLILARNPEHLRDYYFDGFPWYPIYHGVDATGEFIAVDLGLRKATSFVLT